MNQLLWHKVASFIRFAKRKMYVWDDVHLVRKLRKKAEKAFSVQFGEKAPYRQLANRKYTQVQGNNDKYTNTVTFVLLQYNHCEITFEAVESIRQLQSPVPVHIVIVDNGSTQENRNAIEERYRAENNVHLVLLEKNLGFAKGNNAGYAYAKSVLHSSFIIVANNDVTYPDPDLLPKILEVYSKERFAILGPDIQANRDGRTVHQNPMKQKLWTRKEAHIYLEKLEQRLNNIHKLLLTPPGTRGTLGKCNKKITGSIVLHGSAYVLSPIFIFERDFIFCDGTFLYGEEDLLATSSYAEGLKMLYHPDIIVTHNTKSSTDTQDLQAYYRRSLSWGIESTKAYIALLDTLHV